MADPALTGLIRRCADLPVTSLQGIGGAATQVLRRLARRIQALAEEICSHGSS